MAIKSFVALNRRASAWLEARVPSVFGGPDYIEELRRRIDAGIAAAKPRTILEVGGIDRPLLSRKPDYKYLGLDIEERPSCHDVYDGFIVQSIEQPVRQTADMVISTTLLEHVPNNDAAIRVMYGALSPGGSTHHYLPSKWHPYSIALRLVGPVLQKRLIAVLRPDAVAITGYPAFFDHCSPGAMAGLFRQAGFADIDIKPFYRASDYFAFFLPAYVVVALFENMCSGLGLRTFCSGFVISAVRPHPGTARVTHALLGMAAA